MIVRKNEGPQSLQSKVTFRLVVVGIPLPIASQFSCEVNKWSVNSGEEWTIKRIKSLKVDLLRMQAGLSPLSHWVKKKNGSFAGSIGALFKFASLSERNFSRVLQAFMVYTMFQFKTATDSQLEKFTTAVESPSIPIDEDFLHDFCMKAKKFTGRLNVARPLWGNSLLLYRGSPTKTCPVMEWELKRSQGEEVLRNCEFFRKPRSHSDLYSVYRLLYAPVLKGLGLTRLYNRLDYPSDSTIKINPEDISGGKIGLIQEPGGKLRSIANPHLVHQLALKPIGDALYALAKDLPWDCTHDQTLPTQTLQNHLTKKLIVHSVDLSSATDLFPLEIQTSLLRSLFGPILDIDLIHLLSRSSWKYKDDVIRWKKGQPLGLYPSFGMFTVTHGFLLWYLNGCIHNNQFFVVGDDVVILNDELFNKYIQVLSDWKVPWSPDKSLSSDCLCEFAGKVITSKQVIAQMKWREISDKNFIDLCSLLGIRSRTLLRPRQKVVFDQIASLIKPFGLGFNPKGETLQDRITKTEVFLSERKLSSSVMELHGLISNNLYGNGNYDKIRPEKSSLNIDDLLSLLSTFDKKVRGILQTVLPGIGNSEGIPPVSLQGFSTIPEVLGKSDLPHVSVIPSVVTQLDYYESILQKQ
jgi:hypothetical protein